MLTVLGRVVERGLSLDAAALAKVGRRAAATWRLVEKTDPARTSEMVAVPGALGPDPAVLKRVWGYPRSAVAVVDAAIDSVVAGAPPPPGARQRRRRTWWIGPAAGVDASSEMADVVVDEGVLFRPTGEEARVLRIRWPRHERFALITLRFMDQAVRVVLGTTEFLGPA